MDGLTNVGHMGIVRAVSGIIALASITACSSPQHPPPATCDLPQNVHLVVEGSDRMNLDDTGRSLPTIVRIYQLKNMTRMENAEFDDIWHRATATLGGRSVAGRRIHAVPRYARVASVYAQARRELHRGRGNLPSSGRSLVARGVRHAGGCSGAALRGASARPRGESHALVGSALLFQSGRLPNRTGRRRPSSRGRRGSRRRLGSRRKRRVATEHERSQRTQCAVSARRAERAEPTVVEADRRILPGLVLPPFSLQIGAMSGLERAG